MIGVFGGSFAPIHNGHLRLAIEAREQLDIDELRLIPAAAPPLREAPVFPARRRLRWVELAVRGEPGLVADGCELARKGPSYTVDTLAALRALRPREPVCLLLGQDSARRLHRWRRWRELIELAHLAFFNRPGERPQFPAPVLKLLKGREARSVHELHRHPAGLWWRGTMTPMTLSSTDIRARLAAGRSVRGLVPDAVIGDFTSKDLKACRP